MIPKNYNNYVKNIKRFTYWTHSEVKECQTQNFKRNMDSTKYINILESYFDEINSILPNGWIL